MVSVCTVQEAGAGGEAMEREQAEREYLENKKLILQRRLQHVVSSNRRAEEELHRCVVEVILLPDTPCNANLVCFRAR